MKHKGCLLFKETFLHFIYICTNPPPGTYLCRYEKRQKSPSTSCHREFSAQSPTPSLVHPSRSQGPPKVVNVSGSWEQSCWTLSQSPITLLSRKVGEQAEGSECSFVGTARHQDGCRNWSQPQFWVSCLREVSVFQKFPWTRICLFVSFLIEQK